MKRRFLFGLAVMVALCAVAQVGAAEEYRILAEDLPVEEYVRLHILANSDSEEDQALKLKVRDAVLDCARELLGDTCSADDAYAILGEKISLVETCAAGGGRRRIFWRSARASGRFRVSRPAVWRFAGAGWRISRGARVAGRGRGPQLVVRNLSHPVRHR